MFDNGLTNDPKQQEPRTPGLFSSVLICRTSMNSGGGIRTRDLRVMRRSLSFHIFTTSSPTASQVQKGKVKTCLGKPDAASWDLGLKLWSIVSQLNDRSGTG